MTIFLKEEIKNKKYSLLVKNHSKNNNICLSISSIICFINFVLNDCKCGFEHTSSIRKGYSKLSIDTNCDCLFFLKETHNFIYNMIQGC